MRHMVRLALVALGGVMVLIGLMAGASTGSAAGPVLAGTPTATITATVVSTVTVVRNANLRAGPGTSYAVVGSVKAGASLVVTGTNAAGDWLQLQDGKWVAAFLVKPLSSTGSAGGEGQPATATPTAVATKAGAATVTPVPATATSVPPTVAPPTATGAPVGCGGGCTEPPSGCVIKGNVNRDGERIYHTLSSKSYEKTKVNLAEGDRWFCTEDEALAAGFRAPRN